MCLNLGATFFQVLGAVSKKNFMARFYGWGSTSSRLQNHYNSLLFTTKFPEIPGTHSTDLGRMKGLKGLRVTFC